MTKILITGSTDGLGYLTAKCLLDGNNEVVLHARNPKRAQDVLKEFPQVNEVVIGDLASLSEVKALATQINQLGPFDAIIYNAGIYSTNTELTFRVNDLAPYLLTSLVERPKRIVYVSSGMHQGANLDIDNLDQTTNYSSSKFQILLLAKAVARYWSNVTVTSVDPGWVPTKMGGKSATDDLKLGYTSQVWLATTTDTTISGNYYYHKRLAPYDTRTDDSKLQDAYVAALSKITGIKMTK
ncbi:SDR family NAD(P)-dependent oxidoreductase [Lactiplantibacillus paraplantarum]|uniref:SDR family NAD(P)-dependent oxidoreductase n=1 Tax=Lactiplantibacillus paraplantarum TaxID=60520 RepID=A0A4Q9XZ63_9LACO|nr:SDR family NAD(P)-dependent oxidoreductase [Lactiplantibacillus paraplantarum]